VQENIWESSKEEFEAIKEKFQLRSEKHAAKILKPFLRTAKDEMAKFEFPENCQYD